MRMVLLKGQKAEEEIAAARQKFSFDLQTQASQTDSGGRILVLSNILERLS